MGRLGLPRALSIGSQKAHRRTSFYTFSRRISLLGPNGCLLSSSAQDSCTPSGHFRAESPATMWRVREQAITRAETAETACCAYFIRFANVLATPRPPQSGEPNPSASTLCHENANLPRFHPSWAAGSRSAHQSIENKAFGAPQENSKNDMVRPRDEESRPGAPMPLLK